MTDRKFSKNRSNYASMMTMNIPTFMCRNSVMVASAVSFTISRTIKPASLMRLSVAALSCHWIVTLPCHQNRWPISSKNCTPAIMKWTPPPFVKICVLLHQLSKICRRFHQRFKMCADRWTSIAWSRMLAIVSWFLIAWRKIRYMQRTFSSLYFVFDWFQFSSVALVVWLASTPSRVCMFRMQSIPVLWMRNKSIIDWYNNINNNTQTHTYKMYRTYTSTPPGKGILRLTRVPYNLPPPNPHPFLPSTE